jgi:hypothetical protein
MFALNTSRYESTRYTQALLNVGRELVAPHARHPKLPPADEVKEAADAVHHSERLRLLKDTFELVRVNLARAFANRASIITFVTGSGVVIRETAFSNGTILYRPVSKVSPQS